MIKLAYLSVIIIWSTTPLAVYWSSQSGVMFGVTSRMLIGLLSLMFIFFVTRQNLNYSKKAYLAYICAGLGIYIAMSLVYYSVQYIPTGWVSVLFGLSPIITGIASAYVLNENHLTTKKLSGMGLGLMGLVLIFGGSNDFGEHAGFGILLMLLSTFAHSLSAVFIKKVNAPISGIESTYGGLMIAVPLFIFTFYMADESVASFSYKTTASIIYLGVIATAIGFSLYYFILQKLDPVRVSLISLITPVSSLYLGHILNNEAITISIILGTILILIGLVLFEMKINKQKAA